MCENELYCPNYIENSQLSILIRPQTLLSVAII